MIDNGYNHVAANVTCESGDKMENIQDTETTAQNCTDSVLSELIDKLHVEVTAPLGETILQLQAIYGMDASALNALADRGYMMRVRLEILEPAGEP